MDEEAELSGDDDEGDEDLGEDEGEDLVDFIAGDGDPTQHTTQGSDGRLVLGRGRRKQYTKQGSDGR